MSIIAMLYVCVYVLCCIASLTQVDSIRLVYQGLTRTREQRSCWLQIEHTDRNRLECVI